MSDLFQGMQEMNEVLEPGPEPRATIPHVEHKIYEADKTLWACLLMMKYTHRRPEWEETRDSIRATLGEGGMEKLNRAWKESRKDGAI